MNFRVSPFLVLILALLMISPLFITTLAEIVRRPHLLTVQVVQIVYVAVLPMTNYVVNFFAVLMTTWAHPVIFTVACALLCLQNVCWMLVELKERNDKGDRRCIPHFYVCGETISYLWSQYDHAFDDLLGFGYVTVMLIPFVLVNFVWMVPMVILLYFGYATRVAAFIEVQEVWYNVWSNRLRAHDEEEGENGQRPSTIELQRARHGRVAAIRSTDGYEAAARDESSSVDAASDTRPPVFLTNVTIGFDSAGIDTADLTDIHLEEVRPLGDDSVRDTTATSAPSMQPIPSSPPRPVTTPAIESSAPSTTRSPQHREEVKPVLNVLRWLQQDTSQLLFESLPLLALLLVNLIIVGRDVNVPLTIAAMAVSIINAIQQLVAFAFRMGFRTGVHDEANADALAQALTIELRNRCPLTLLNLDPSAPTPTPPLMLPSVSLTRQRHAQPRPVEELEEGGVPAGQRTDRTDDGHPSPPAPPGNLLLTWTEPFLAWIGFGRTNTAPRRDEPAETTTAVTNTSQPETAALSETLPPQLMRLFHQHQENTYRHIEDLEDRTGLRLAILESKLDAVMPLLAMMESQAVPLSSSDVPTVVSSSVVPPPPPLQAVAAPPAPVEAVAAPRPPPRPAVTISTHPPAVAPASAPAPAVVPSPVAPTPPIHSSSSSPNSSPSPFIVARPNMQYYYLR